jgi:hypothetical protein
MKDTLQIVNLDNAPCPPASAGMTMGAKMSFGRGAAASALIERC